MTQRRPIGQRVRVVGPNYTGCYGTIEDYEFGQYGVKLDGVKLESGTRVYFYPRNIVRDTRKSATGEVQP